jgi:AraC-like DNA-binding protein
MKLPADSYATLCRRLVIDGGFRVDGGRYRQLEERARRLGFADLRTCLQVLSDSGCSVPQRAEDLDTTPWQVSRALRELGVRLQDRRARLALQRQRAAEKRVTERAAQLGFADVRAYLVDRVAERGWVRSAVATELGVAPVTVRRLLDRHGVRRSRRTAGERAASARGRRVQAGVWQARGAARLGELGFAGLASYLRVRRVEQGWSVRRMRAELGVGRAWLVAEMRRLGITP